MNLQYMKLQYNFLTLFLVNMFLIEKNKHQQLKMRMQYLNIHQLLFPMESQYKYWQSTVHMKFLLLKASLRELLVTIH